MYIRYFGENVRKDPMCLFMAASLHEAAFSYSMNRKVKSFHDITKFIDQRWIIDLVKVNGLILEYLPVSMQENELFQMIACQQTHDAFAVHAPGAEREIL